ncbi:hypothetical protein [Ensifer sp. MJa1]|uniref:hypothetical protein n=1 Tax=Ensifer sp. MJa1 TaxID=2919888 RepID=UPI003007F8BC
MTLFRAIHAIKVLALAGLFVATTIIPLEARDWGGSRGVQMRTNHVRMNSHRFYPRYNFNRMGHRGSWGRNGIPRRDWVSDNGLREPQIRTRHNRLPRYRYYDGPYTDRFGHRGGWMRDRAGRDIWTSGGRRNDGRPGIYDGLSEPQTRTRHNRFPGYRPYPGPYAERWGNGGGWIRDRAGREIWTTSGRPYSYGRGSYGGDDFPDSISGIGTYGGGISAYSDPGNGIYINVEGNYVYSDDGDYTQPPQGNRGKIINVTPKNMNSSCSYEHGVCVIRR